MSTSEFLAYPKKLIAWHFVSSANHISDEVFRLNNHHYMTSFYKKLEGLGVQFRTGLGVNGIKVKRAEMESGISSVHVELNQVEHSGRKFQAETIIADFLIMAMQPIDALHVLKDDASDEEKDILSKFVCRHDTAILHQDPKWLPRREQDWRPLNIKLPVNFQDGTSNKFMQEENPNIATVPMTTVFPCDNDGKTPIMVTYDYDRWRSLPPHASAKFFKGETTDMVFTHTRVDVSTPALRCRVKK